MTFTIFICIIKDLRYNIYYNKYYICMYLFLWFLFIFRGCYDFEYAILRNFIADIFREMEFLLKTTFAFMLYMLCYTICQLRKFANVSVSQNIIKFNLKRKCKTNTISSYSVSPEIIKSNVIIHIHYTRMSCMLIFFFHIIHSEIFFSFLECGIAALKISE